MVLELSADSMADGRRMGVTPIPADLGAYLNDLQMTGLRKVEEMGWSLKYVRRPAFQTPTVVLVYSDGYRLGLLEDNGMLNEHAMIRERGDSAPQPTRHLV